MRISGGARRRRRGGGQAGGSRTCGRAVLELKRRWEAADEGERFRLGEP